MANEFHNVFSFGFSRFETVVPNRLFRYDPRPLDWAVGCRL
jgi:hypothetical protein